jgi:hypothetical protein
MEVVGGSIPLATTISPTLSVGFTRRSDPPECRTLALQRQPSFRRGFMFKFLGSAVGIIFLIGLVVVILLLKFIF